MPLFSVHSSSSISAQFSSSSTAEPARRGAKHMRAMINVLTIDVEEYFHPTEVQLSVGRQNWMSLPSRVAWETERVLELLARYDISATFFILGWIAHRHPQVV